MTTLADLFPVQMSDRPLRFDSRSSPFELLAQECGRITAEAGAESDKLLSAIGESVFQLGRLHEDYARTSDPQPHIADALDILAANLTELLEEHQVQVIDLTGQELTAEARKQVEIRAQQVNPEVTVRTVRHMEAPIILRHRRLITEGVVTLDVPAAVD